MAGGGFPAWMRFRGQGGCEAVKIVYRRIGGKTQWHADRDFWMHELAQSEAGTCSDAPPTSTGSPGTATLPVARSRWAALAFYLSAAGVINEVYQRAVLPIGAARSILQERVTEAVPHAV